MLAIFGSPPPGSALKGGEARIRLPVYPVASPNSPHAISGKLVEMSGSTLTLQTRTGKEAKVDATQAIKNRKVGARLKAGVPLTVLGSAVNSAGALDATAIIRAKGSSGLLWPGPLGFYFPMGEACAAFRLSPWPGPIQSVIL